MAEESEDQENNQANLGENEKFCKSCGETIKDDAEICPECGVRVEDTEKQDISVNVENSNQNIQAQGSAEGFKGSKSKIVAALLAFTLGWIGGHKFYLGQAGRGIIFILFSWTGIPFLLSIIQGIGYLLMSDEKFARKFG